MKRKAPPPPKEKPEYCKLTAKYMSQENNICTSHLEATRENLEELIHACQDAIDSGFSYFRTRRKLGTYFTEMEITCTDYVDSENDIGRAGVPD